MVDKEDSVSKHNAVPYTLRQPSNVVGELCGLGVFIGSAYELDLSLAFSCGRVKYPLEVYSTVPYVIHCMVGLCT